MIRPNQPDHGGDPQRRPSRDPGRGSRRSQRRGGDARKIAEELRADPELRDALEHWRELPPRPGRLSEFPRSLDPRVVEVTVR